MPPSQWGHIPTSLHFLGVSCPRCPRSISACPRFRWGQTIRASIGFAGDFEFAPAAPVFKTPTPKFKALAIMLASRFKVLSSACSYAGNSCLVASVFLCAGLGWSGGQYSDQPSGCTPPQKVLPAPLIHAGTKRPRKLYRFAAPME
jgi:hypothetical protein